MKIETPRPHRETHGAYEQRDGCVAFCETPEARGGTAYPAPAQAASAPTPEIATTPEIAYSSTASFVA